MIPHLAGFVRNMFGPKYADSATPINVTLGQNGEMMVSQGLPPFAAAALRSKVFQGNQLPAGAAPALWSATTQQCGLFNPLGSGVNLILAELTGTYVSGTGIVNGLCLGYKTGCGATIATAAPVITAATLIDPVALDLSGAVSVAQFMSAGITTAAPVRLMNLGLNTEVGTAPTAATERPLIYSFEGKVVVRPGTAIFIAANITGITAVYSFGLTWMEIPA